MTQQLHEVFEESIGQTPHDMPIGNTDQDARIASLGPIGNRVLDAPGRFEHVRERKPERVLNFIRREFDLLALVQEKHVGRDDERRTRSRVSDDVVETTEILRMREFDSHLLKGFASRSRARRIIALLETPARKRHMP